MLVTLRQQLTQFAHMLQNELFPTIEAEVGELGEQSHGLVPWIVGLVSSRGGFSLFPSW